MNEAYERVVAKGKGGFLKPVDKTAIVTSLSSRISLYCHNQDGLSQKITPFSFLYNPPCSSTYYKKRSSDTVDWIAHCLLRWNRTVALSRDNVPLIIGTSISGWRVNWSEIKNPNSPYIARDTFPNLANRNH